MRLLLLLLLASTPLGEVLAQVWPANSASFLEPNRLLTSFELPDDKLQLAVGYGGPIYQARTELGAEMLIWSQLSTLSEFRFPVETADYFFGVYWTFILADAPWRLRLSHISSHAVDGRPDSVTSVRSSRFSREFISLETAWKESVIGIDLRGSLGIRWVFHQVQKLEPRIQSPATVEARVFSPARASSVPEVTLSLSSANSPSAPSISASVVTRFPVSEKNAVEVFSSSNYGSSRYGIEIDRRYFWQDLGVRLTPYFSWK